MTEAEMDSQACFILPPLYRAINGIIFITRLQPVC